MDATLSWLARPDRVCIRPTQESHYWIFFLVSVSHRDRVGASRVRYVHSARCCLAPGSGSLETQQALLLRKATSGLASREQTACA